MPIEGWVVGEVGLEPTISCSQSTCVANYATPRAGLPTEAGPIIRPHQLLPYGRTAMEGATGGSSFGSPGGNTSQASHTGPEQGTFGLSLVRAND
jgi:hypothetical protein